MSTGETPVPLKIIIIIIFVLIFIMNTLKKIKMIYLCYSAGTYEKQ
jgi:hypothetical protein